MKQNTDESLALSLVRDDLPFRLQRRVGLILLNRGFSSAHAVFRLAYLVAYCHLGSVYEPDIAPAPSTATAHFGLCSLSLLCLLYLYSFWAGVMRRVVRR